MFASALSCLLPAAALALGQVTVVDRPDTSARNSFYAGNRPPLAASPWVKLPLGAVAPQGWLRKQLELQAAGFHGHLGQISRFLEKEGNAWLSPTGDGDRGWEEVPYWLKGFGDCAYLLGNELQTAEARVWIEGALASQREDGFFGPRGKGAKSTVGSTQGKYDLWPNMVMLCCLQSYYERFGDRRILDLMTRYFRWELSIPENEFLPPYWQQQRAGDNLWSVLWLYNRTGEAWLLDLAHKVYRHTADWTGGIPNWHNVNVAQAFGGPAYYWPLSGDAKHLAAAERNFEEIRQTYGQVPGGLFGGDEVCRPGFGDPRQAVETCGMVEMMFSCERLLQVSGDARWADRCEDVAFNSLPAALTADFKALRYLTAPNMILSDRGDKSPGLRNRGPMLLFDPYKHRCCQHNFGHGWPYLVEHLWMASADAGLAAVMYGPSTVTARVGDGTEVRVAESTHYPFSGEIELTVSAPQPVTFPLYLRLPGWCRGAALSVNGQAQPVAVRPLSYVCIRRQWSQGDTVTLTLDTPITLERWAGNHDSVSVNRGPLTFSLAIEEQYVREGGSDEWPAWEIHPASDWNYGLVLDDRDPACAFQVKEKPWPESEMPFVVQNAPLVLTGRGKKIPPWQMDRQGLVGLLQPSPVKSAEPVETIRLIPMGAARLRIASFPVIGEGSAAHEWKAPPRAD